MSQTPYAQVKTNPRFERGWNALQTSIQLGVTLVVVAGLVGCFGTGPISKGTTSSPDGNLTMQYERILRRTVQTDMFVHFKHVAGATLVVAVPASFVQEMDIVSTSPRSTRMQAGADGISYLFDTGSATSGTISLSMKPKSFGLFDSWFRVGDHDLAVQQFVWP